MRRDRYPEIIIALLALAAALNEVSKFFNL